MILLAIYCALIATASAAGGTLPTLIKMTHHRMQLIVSLVCGVMLGVALLHMLPHSIQILGNVHLATILVLCGLLVMLFLIRIFNFHHHDFGSEHIHSEGCDHGPRNGHDIVVIGSIKPEAHVPRDLSWIGLCFGLAIHTMLDGIALAAALQAEQGGHVLAGFGTFLAIALHKPLDAISITALMAAKKFPVSRQMVVNLIFALMAPLGAILFTLTVQGLAFEIRQIVLGTALALSAGFFLCISLGDLLPEVHFHSHDRIWLSLMLLAGVAVAFILEFAIGHGSFATP